MYVCTCNDLTERAVADAARSGAAAVSQIYAALDCAPQCGKCLPRIREILAAASQDAGRPVSDGG